MKLFPASMFLAALCVVLSGGCSQEITTDSWKPYQSSDGGFSVEMPGSPQASEQDVPTDVGMLPMKIISVETHGGRQAFMVFYNDYPREAVDEVLAEQMLQDAKAGVVEGYGNTSVTNEQDVTLDGHPGKEFEFTTVEDGETVNAAWKLFMRDNRLYQVALVSVGADYLEEHRKKFFDSFQFESLP